MNNNPQALKNFASFFFVEQEVRNVDNFISFGHAVTNETSRLVYFDKALLWSNQNSKIKIEAISNVPGIDTASSYIQDLTNFYHEIIQNNHQDRITTLSDTDTGTAYTSKYILLCPLVTQQGKHLGGLILESQKKWSDAELETLKMLSGTYAHAWQALKDRKKINLLPQDLFQGKKRKIILFSILVFLCFPVKLSVLAPAEITAANPVTMSAQLSGIIENIYVSPNQTVNAGDKLFSLNQTEIKNNFDVASMALKVAQTEYRQAKLKAFQDDRIKSGLAIYEARIKQKEAEREYAKGLKERSIVYAPRSGTVIFSDPHDWIGRPVQIGEKVMTLAQPDELSLRIDLGIDNAINLNRDKPVKVFLNTMPLRPVKGTISSVAFEAQATDSGTLAYRVKANIKNSSKNVRIGMKGTAKLYGRYVPFVYHLFRRPLSSARRWIGL